MIHKVPFLNDVPGLRGEFIESRMTGDMVYLSKAGRLVPMQDELQQKIRKLDARSEGMPVVSKVAEDQMSLRHWIAYTERVKKIFV